jgi:hypothetical protein
MEARCRAYVAHVIYHGLQTSRRAAANAQVSVFEAAYFVCRNLLLLRSVAAPQSALTQYDLYRSRSLALTFAKLFHELEGEKLRMIPLAACRKLVWTLMEEAYQKWQPRTALPKSYDLARFLLAFYTPEHASDPARQFLHFFLTHCART